MLTCRMWGVVGGLVLGGLVVAGAVHGPRTVLSAALAPVTDLTEEARRAEGLGDANRVCMRRIAIKEQLVADLIADRITLARATAEFLILNRSDEACSTVLRRTFPGRTDFERTAHSVLAHVEGQLSTSAPAARDRVNVRLALQMADLVDAAGLPADPDLRELVSGDAAGPE
jgi:hypothetical protein